MKDTLERKSQRSPYYDIHRGKTLLLKVSGTQFEGKKFEALAAAIHKFVQEGIRVMMVDDVVGAVAAHCAGSIHEVMMVTETGGVLDDKGKVVPLLPTATIDEILADSHPDIHVKGGMLQKLRQVREMLQHVAKVSITDDPQREIEQWRGRGTLCIDETQLEFGPANKHDAAIFRQAHADLVKEGKFRPRTPVELSQAALHHFCLRLDGAPLAGLSLIPRGRKWSELACLWSSYPKNGIAKRLMQEALEEAHGHKVYALTCEDNAKRLFERMDFVPHGGLRGLQHDSSFPLPCALKQYDTSQRQPSVFTFGLNGSKKKMPSRQAAAAIDDLLREADTVACGETYHGQKPNPDTLRKAKRLLARYGRTERDWDDVADEYGFCRRPTVFTLSPSSPELPR